jgi:hypothetical protein
MLPIFDPQTGSFFPFHNCRTNNKTEHPLSIKGNFSSWTRIEVGVKLKKQHLNQLGAGRYGYRLKEMRGWDRLMKQRSIHLFSGNEQRFCRNVVPLVLFMVLCSHHNAFVNFHGTRGCHLPSRWIMMRLEVIWWSLWQPS